MNQETIEKYLHNEMSPEERTAFEQAAAADPALALELRIRQQVEQGVTGMADAKAGLPVLEQTIARLNQQYFDKKEQTPVVPINRRKRWYYGIAAAAAVIAFVVFVIPLLKRDTGSDLAALYTTYGKYNPISGVGVRSDKNQEDRNKNKADSLFNTANYAAALPLLAEINVQNPADTERYLALGVCYSKTGNAAKAISIFDAVAMGKSGNTDAAVWYKALHYLLQKDAPACRKVLEAIPNESEYYKEAKELLKGL